MENDDTFESYDNRLIELKNLVYQAKCLILYESEIIAGCCLNEWVDHIEKGEAIAEYQFNYLRNIIPDISSTDSMHSIKVPSDLKELFSYMNGAAIVTFRLFSRKIFSELYIHTLLSTFKTKLIFSCISDVSEKQAILEGYEVLFNFKRYAKGTSNPLKVYNLYQDTLLKFNKLKQKHLREDASNDIETLNEASKNVGRILLKISLYKNCINALQVLRLFRIPGHFYLKYLCKSINNVIKNSEELIEITQDIFKSDLESLDIVEENIFKSILNTPNNARELECYFSKEDLIIFSSKTFSEEDKKQKELEFKQNLLEWSKKYSCLKDLNVDTGNINNSILELELPQDLFEKYEEAYDTFWLGSVNKKCKDPCKISKFINEIAKQGHINNDIITKKSMAFRLTGRNKPENLLEKIPWNSALANIVYFLKYFASDINGNYRHFVKFLEPKVPKKEEDLHTLLKKANLGFKRVCHATFPDVFPECDK